MIDRSRLGWMAAAILIGIAAAFVPRLRSYGSPRTEEAVRMAPAVGMPGGPPTSAAGLQQRIAEMDGRLQRQPRDLAAAVLLSDALLRQSRASNDARPANRASEVLKAVLKEHPGQYDALRMLGAINLSQHKFREALEVGTRARDERPGDAWNYGVMGDAWLELGDYDKAFAAFDTMMSLRPNAAAYARIAYARELRGDLTGALEAMQVALTAAAPQDPEAQAWHATQLGELLLKMGRLPEADREFRRAVFVYPDYPLANIGRGKVKMARGEHDEALKTFLDQLKRTPTLELAARIGDLYAERGDTVEAERYYQVAEDVAGPAIAQTEANLALFLAERGRTLPEAVRIAETVAATRDDIFTDDALAWAYFKVGRLAEAQAAAARALRTGTKDDRILSHAARIREAAASRASGPNP
jgi:tetratricopeptide (TPR) repeat protein